MVFGFDLCCLLSMSGVSAVWRVLSSFVVLFFFKQKTAYEMRISDWSSDVCSSDLCRWWQLPPGEHQGHPPFRSRSIIDRTGLHAKFGQFRRARAPEPP